MLGNQAILNNLINGDIEIDPFDEQNLGPNSYDVRLDGHFYFPNLDFDEENLMDFTNPEMVKMFWQYLEFKTGQFVVINPGQTILATTIERIGGRNTITSEMRARSSIGRAGLSVCKCAGFGDVGYIAKWTMEISNHNKCSVSIPIGMRVAQIVFHKVEGVTKQYSGRYGMKDWQPSDMLPKW